MNQKVKLAQIRYYALKASFYEHEAHHRVMFNAKGNSQRRISSVLYRMAQCDNECLLDIACGTGNILRTAKRYYCHTIGIDISVDMARIAKGQSLAIVNADADFLPFRSDTFSAVTCYSGLHHMEKWEQMFKEVLRVLKPGGVFYTDWDPHGPAVKNQSLVNLANCLVNIVRGQKRERHLRELEDLAERHRSYSPDFSANRLRDLLLSAGYKDVTVYYHNDSSELPCSDLKLSDYVYYVLRYALFLTLPRFRRDELMRYFSLHAKK